MGTKFTVYDHGVSPAKAQGLVEKAYMLSGAGRRGAT